MGVKLNLKEFLMPLRQCTARPQGSSDCDGYMEFSFCFRSRARAKRSDVGGLSRMIGDNLELLSDVNSISNRTSPRGVS